jgi:hypothetical protein
MSNMTKAPTPARVSALHKIDTAANLNRQPTARAHVLVTWRRPRTLGVIVRCFACDRLHQHSVALDDAAPVLRASRCGLATYLLDVDDALAVTA